MKQTATKHRIRRKNEPLLFFKQFFRHPGQIGAIIPSTRFLEQRILNMAQVRSARMIVELGTGTGSTTRAILRSMAPDARLLGIEINPHLYTLAKNIQDDRLIVHHGSAADLAEILQQYHCESPDIIISGIPFSTIPPVIGSAILRSISGVLSPNGRFVAYQMRDHVAKLGKPFLGSAQQSRLELLNLPPMRVYRWDRSSMPGSGE